MDDKISLNGSAHSSVANGAPITTTKKPLIKRKQKSNPFVALLSSLLRLAFWASILTVFFTCPSSSEDLTSDSSQLCKSYVDLRSRLAPHLEPHYNTYLKPYADRAQPHLDQFNRQIYSPTAEFVGQNYKAYAAPRVALAQDYVISRWSQNVQPQIEHGKDWAKHEYEEHLSPHVSKALKVSEPYIRKTQSELTDVYESTVIPMYDRSLPYAQNAYHKSHHVAAYVVLPYAQKIHSTISAFLSRNVWPRLIILYGENVEPQLTRITERLGRYKDSKKLEAYIEETDASASVASVVSAASSASSVAASASIEINVPDSGAHDTPNASDVPSEADVREKIESDLKTWQTKFANAADKGTEDLQERVNDITTKQVHSQAHGVGSALVIQLENTVESSIRDLKSQINTSISKLPLDVSDSEEDVLYDELLNHLRSTGEKIRKKALAVRQWKQKYDNETQSLVQAALDSTLDVIDNIRDLGLQEIGMRWAWMEGVTYKDWSKYHALKKTFDTWRDQVADAALKHQGLSTAKEQGEAVQDEAMRVAESAANELKRLKEVAKWKVYAHDATDDFSSKVIPARAVKAARSIASVGSQSVSEALSSASSFIHSSSAPANIEPLEIVKDGVDQAINTVRSAASAAADKFSSATSNAGPSASSVSSSASAQISQASEELAEKLSVGTSSSSSSAPAKVWGGVAAGFVEGKQVDLDDDFNSWSDQISSLLDAAGDKASELTDAVSAALLKPTSTQGTVESVTSLASEQYAQALSAASSVLFGTPQPLSESVASVASDKYAQAVAAASHAIYGAPTAAVQSLASQASSAYGVGASEVQEALASITALASSRLSEGLSQVSAQYTSAKIAVGAQPPPLHQQYISEAQRRYYEGLGLAHDQYSRFVDGASSAVYGTPTPWHQSLASEASRKVIGTPIPAYQSLLSQAESQYSMVLADASQKYDLVQNSAKKIMGSTTDIHIEKLLARASLMFEAATSRAGDTFAEATSSASLAVYGSSTGIVESVASKVSEGVVGTETPWTEEMASKAADNYNALIAKASEQIYGTPTPFAHSAWNQAGEYAAQATDAAASQYLIIQAIVSELVVGKEPDFTESVMNRLSSAYHTGVPAVVASASSIASEAYDSASSVITAVFTPPASLEVMIDSASSSFQAAVDAASAQIYGTTPGYVEQAASVVADSYSSAQSVASEAIYGTQPSYFEAAQNSLAAAASLAQESISVAIYGTPTGAVEAATNSAANVYASVSSAAGENLSAAGDAVKDSYSAVSSHVSKAVYGPEYGTWESASLRIAAAADSASSQIASMMSDASASAQSAASKVGSAASDATARIKDEL